MEKSKRSKFRNRDKIKKFYYQLVNGVDFLCVLL